MKKWFSIHNHTDASNFRLRDSINKVEALIDYAASIGLSGICITDHEALSNHVKAFKYLENCKNKGKLPENFSIGFGNEIYLVDREEVNEKKERNERISFHHFILLAKNERGYEALKKLSSEAWSNSFYYKGIERVPTYKDCFEKIIMEYQGDLIASTACVGGEVPQMLIEYHNNPTQENKKRVNDLVLWLKYLFNEDIYFELQPSRNEDQLIANEMLLKVGKAYGIKCIVSTDAHYLNKEKALAHEFYLKASEGDREVASFYATTYVMSSDELLEFFDSSILDGLIENTFEIQNKLEPITFEQRTKVPKAHIFEFKLKNLFAPFYSKYEYIKKYAESELEIDRFYLSLIEQGMIDKNQDLNEENLSRINDELKELYLTSKRLEQPMSSYFVLTKELIDIMWEVSLVGPGRGSAPCYYVNYLLDIVQFNPIKYKLPLWRFLTHERPSMPDIDIDSEGSKRHEIIKLVKEKYGYDSVLNMGTMTTEKTRSTVLTACRGHGIDNDISQNIANLIPTEKGGIWSLKECLFGNPEKNKKPVREFIEEVESHPGLKETMLEIEGLVSGRGQHASGLIVFPNGYIKQNAMMRTTSGLEITQFDAYDSEYMGGLKFDFLSINALDRIRASLDLLLKTGKIQWQGSLRKTYNKYFHPDVLEMEAPEMFDLLFEGHVLNSFQFETPVGQQALRKINARTFNELSAANALMRLSCQGEQPLDKFIRFKKDTNLWYEEMKNEGLNEDEIKVLESYLLDKYGICDTQESLMLLSMDKNISGFDLTQANKFRKAVAKQNKDLIEEERILFYEEGSKLNVSKEMLDYVWYKLLSPQFGYSFSSPHIAAYTLVLMIEMNICYKFNPVYWKTSCLSVNSGLLGENASGTNYGAIAKAVGDMKGIVKNPSINKSDLGFAPLEEEGKILFGFKPISGLGIDATNLIIQNRPYTSFEDFYERLVKTGMISVGKVVTLIKAGCFDEFEKDRRKLMVNFVREITPKREKLTMTQLPSVIHLADKEEYKEELALYLFRNMILGRKKVPMSKEIEKIFIENYSKDVKFSFDNTGKLKIDEKSFNKFYGKKIEKLKNWLLLPETAEMFNKIKMQEFWKENCMGSVESWEMETVLFYSDKHELDYMPLNQYFNIVNFRDLPEEPVITEYKSWRGRQIPRLKIDVISGTVVEKVKGKSLVYVLTQYGVVMVKYNKGQFAHYDKKIVRINVKEKQIIEESWFKRGTKLVLVGFRRGEEFVLRTTGSQYQHTTFKILGSDGNKVFFQTEKAGE